MVPTSYSKSVGTNRASTAIKWESWGLKTYSGLEKLDFCPSLAGLGVRVKVIDMSLNLLRTLILVSWKSAIKTMLEILNIIFWKSASKLKSTWEGTRALRLSESPFGTKDQCFLQIAKFYSREKPTHTRDMESVSFYPMGILPPR